MSDREAAGGPAEVLFLYWGRRSSISFIAVEIARILARRPELGGAISYSANNELADEMAATGPVAWPFPTFRHPAGLLTGLPRFYRQARALVRRLQAERTRGLVVLMSHVWTPLFGRMLKKAGIRTLVIVHDPRRHPGDYTAILHSWLMRDLRSADLAVTLSQDVARRLEKEWRWPAEKTAIVPHPVMAYGGRRTRRADGPLRVLFFGRIMTYKGLGLLVEAAEILRQRGVPIELGVYGEGDLGALRPRLEALGATIVNRWLAHGEVGAAIAEWDVLALPYIEASQSGVVAAGRGSGLPSIVTPVGGLTEQVRHEVDGLVAARVDAEAVADAIARLVHDPGLFDRLAANASALVDAEGVEAFALRLRDLALDPEAR